MLAKPSVRLESVNIQHLTWGEKSRVVTRRAFLIAGVAENQIPAS
jgi:hypothetical protein